MKKLLHILLFSLASLQVSAQLANKVLVSPDYRGSGSNAIVVKWVPEMVMYSGGFNVYRQALPNDEWAKLNTAPILPTSAIPTGQEGLAEEYKESYNIVKAAPEADLHKATLIRAFITLDILRSRELGELLGLVWYDETAVPGQQYRYKVEAITGKGTVSLGESVAVASGKFAPLAAPKDIVVARSGERVTLRWAIDESVSVATWVEKSTGNGPYVPMAAVPYYISKNTNTKGEAQYADVFIADTEIERGQTYRYRLAAVDFFGQKGEYSQVHYAGMKGATMPSAPINVEASVNDATKEIALNWTHQSPTSLRGFVVLYRGDMTDEPQLFVADTLSSSSTSHTFKASADGSYLVTVSAVDVWGNVAESAPVLAQIDDVTPPAIPNGLQATLQEGIITITWNAPPDTDVLGYQVYRTSSKDASPNLATFIPMGNDLVTATSYKDAVGSSLSGKVFYSVAAIDKSYNRSERSAPVGMVMPDSEAPSVPFIKAITATEKTLLVQFMPNVDDDLAFFILNRTDSEGKGIEIQLTANTTQYEDKEVKSGLTYTYSMRAQDMAGNVSSSSTEVEAIAPGVDESVLTSIKPTAISVKLSKSVGKVQLTWTQKFPTENLGVVIFRGNDKENLMPISGLQRAAGYLDETALPGNTYYYQVRTYTANGLQHQSEINEIIIKAK